MPGSGSPKNAAVRLCWSRNASRRSRSASANGQGVKLGGIAGLLPRPSSFRSLAIISMVSPYRSRRAHPRLGQTVAADCEGCPSRVPSTNRGFDARLSGGGSYEGQCRCAFLLYRQENISERTPPLLGRTILCRLCNESGGSEVWGRHAHEQACSVMCIVDT